MPLKIDWPSTEWTNGYNDASEAIFQGEAFTLADIRIIRESPHSGFASQEYWNGYESRIKRQAELRSREDAGVAPVRWYNNPLAFAIAIVVFMLGILVATLCK